MCFMQTQAFLLQLSERWHFPSGAGRHESQHVSTSSMDLEVSYEDGNEQQLWDGGFCT